jgi:hypothetical protein
MVRKLTQSQVAGRDTSIATTITTDEMMPNTLRVAGDTWSYNMSKLMWSRWRRHSAEPQNTVHNQVVKLSSSVQGKG